MLVLIDDPKYDTQKVSQTAVKLKEEIRSKYKSKINNYYKDIIIHVSDNSIEASSVYRFILQIEPPIVNIKNLNKILEGVNFLVLRNYHNLHKVTPKYPDDIDILTDDYCKILKSIKPYLVKIDNPKVGHILDIKGEKVKLDIRVIGFNYYDNPIINNF